VSARVSALNGARPTVFSAGVQRAIHNANGQGSGRWRWLRAAHVRFTAHAPTPVVGYGTVASTGVAVMGGNAKRPRQAARMGWYGPCSNRRSPGEYAPTRRREYPYYATVRSGQRSKWGTSNRGSGGGGVSVQGEQLSVVCVPV